MAFLASSIRGAALIGLLFGAVAPGNAYLYWSKLPLAGAPATGDDPAVVRPLPKATDKELQANLVWTMRAGLNVAALQCQFAPSLHTVDNYNNMLRQHGVELQSTYATLSAYFKRVQPKTWQTALDQYTTRTYNSFSTLNAQMSFCEVAAEIGRETRERKHGELGAIASNRLREFRNSLTPVGDASFGMAQVALAVTAPDDLDDIPCYDKKGRLKPCKKKN